MFIAHGEKVQKYSRWILVGVLVVIIPGMVLLFTATGPSGRSNQALPTFAGKPMDPAQFELAKSAVRDQFVISEMRPLPGGREYDEAIAREAVIRFLLLRKAREMGIHVSEEALLSGVRRQPTFVGENGEFIFDRYRQYLILLNNHGISEQRFLNLMRDQMIIGQLQDLISNAAKVTPQEVELQYAPLHEKLWIELVRFDVANTQVKPTISDEDAAKYFEQNKERFKKPAQVNVRYAKFGFDAAQKEVKLTEAELKQYYQQNLARYMTWDTNSNTLVTNKFESVQGDIREDLALLEARRQVGHRAGQFAIQIQPEPGATNRIEFAKLAAAAGATVGETGFFAEADTIKGVQAGAAFKRAAFAMVLMPEQPYSDPIAGEDGYYVLEYLDHKPARIPELAEVKAEVIEQVQRERVYEATTAAGRQALDNLRQLISQGQTFAQAAAALKLKPQAHGPFTIAGNELEVAGAGQIAQTVLGLKTGALSDFIQTAEGGLFYQLKDRQPFDRAAFEKDKAVYERQMLARHRQAIFQNWLGTLLQQEQVSLNQPRPALPEPSPEPAGEQS